MASFIGREEERRVLLSLEKSEKSEFVAIYGRRRVGKTFLVDETFRGKFAFSMSGVLEGKKTDQLQAFSDALASYGAPLGKALTNWHDAFDALKRHLESLRKRKKVVFIDELPCLDTPKSGLVRALDHFWNAWASKRNDILLIVCGSATSWIVRNIIDNHGGLHNRITREVHLHQFTLKETEEYLKNKGCHWNRLSITQLYMAMGGIPYYLSLVEADKSLPQNLDRLYFAQDAPLRGEYRRLYKSLFRSPEKYMKIISVLAKRREGMTRNEIAEATQTESNGHLTDILEDLTYCDFIRPFRRREKKIRRKDCIYQLVDFYTIFYLHFCTFRTTDEHYWSNKLDTSDENSWYGLSYERVCFAHIPQILRALGVDRIHTEYYSWRSNENVKAQIDLIIERDDQIANICEVKFSKYGYSLSSSEEANIRKRIGAFRSETGIRHGLVATLITTYLPENGKHSDLVSQVIDMDQLFS